MSCTSGDFKVPPRFSLRSWGAALLKRRDFAGWAASKEHPDGAGRPSRRRWRTGRPAAHSGITAAWGCNSNVRSKAEATTCPAHTMETDISLALAPPPPLVSVSGRGEPSAGGNVADAAHHCRELLDSAAAQLVQNEGHVLGILWCQQVSGSDVV